MTADRSQQRLVRALYRIGRALARIVIRHGLSAKDVQNIFKKAFVDVAREDYGINGRPTNKARVATLTGLTRVEVARLVEALPPGQQAYDSQHPLRRVVEKWLQDKPWASTRGDPKALPVQNADNSFSALVNACGGDIAWQTLLKELVRLGVVVRDGDTVELTQHGFIPTDIDGETVSIVLGEHVPGLLDTISHNLGAPAEQRRFQRAVHFDNLSEAGWAKLEKLAAESGQKLLETAHDALEDDRDTDAPRGRESKGMGIYIYRIDDPDGGQQ